MPNDININNVDIHSISEEDLPTLIRSQCELLNDLDQKILAATQKAQSAKRASVAASNQKIGWFRKGKAIEANQTANLRNAEANEATVEAVSVLAEYQHRIAGIMKWFLALGTTSIAMNRATIKQLEALLQGGAVNNLSDATKDELKGVIRDLKNQEDFMQRQSRTEQTVKLHEKKFSKIERSQKMMFGGAIVLLAVVVGTAIFVTARPPEVVYQQEASTTDSTENNELIDSLDNVDTDDSDFDESKQLPTAEKANQSQETTSDYNNAENQTVDSEEKIQLGALVGEASVKGAYITIFERNGCYYFNFVVKVGSRVNNLYPPVLLTADGDRATATYTDDGQGNSGSVQITMDSNNQRFISAQIDNKWLKQYDDNNNLNALILDHEKLYYNKEIREYPIYQEYLEPDNFTEGIDLSFLSMKKEYRSIASNDTNILTFSNVSANTTDFCIMDGHSEEVVYQGNIQAKSMTKDFVLLTGTDGSIEIECYYEGYCRVKTSDGQYNLTVFK